MNLSGLATAMLLTTIIPLGLATHDDGCVPGAADPSTYNVIDLTGTGGELYYVEERDNPAGTSPPVPLSGLALGTGTFAWQEQNGLAGLQRGDSGLPFTCLPPAPLPCLIVDEDPIGDLDENCGHGADTLDVIF